MLNSWEKEQQDNIRDIIQGNCYFLDHAVLGSAYNFQYGHNFSQYHTQRELKNTKFQDFPGGLVVKTPHFQWRGMKV